MFFMLVASKLLTPLTRRFAPHSFFPQLVAYRFDEELWGHSGSEMTVFDETPHSYKTMVVVPLGGFFQER